MSEAWRQGSSGVAGGLWGALAAVGIAALSGLVTQIAMIVGYRREPTAFVGIVAGSWLAKMIIIAASVVLLKGVESVDRGTFGTVLLLGSGCNLGHRHVCSAASADSIHQFEFWRWPVIGYACDQSNTDKGAVCLRALPPTPRERCEC